MLMEEYSLKSAWQGHLGAMWCGLTILFLARLSCKGRPFGAGFPPRIEFKDGACRMMPVVFSVLMGLRTMIICSLLVPFRLSCGAKSWRRIVLLGGLVGCLRSWIRWNCIRKRMVGPLDSKWLCYCSFSSG